MSEVASPVIARGSGREAITVAAREQNYLNACDAALCGSDDASVSRLDGLVRGTVEFPVHRRIESNIGAREWRNLAPVHQARLVEARRSATRLWADRSQRTRTRHFLLPDQ